MARHPSARAAAKPLPAAGAACIHRCSGSDPQRGRSVDGSTPRVSSQPAQRTGGAIAQSSDGRSLVSAAATAESGLRLAASPVTGGGSMLTGMIGDCVAQERHVIIAPYPQQAERPWTKIALVYRAQERAFSLSVNDALVAEEKCNVSPAIDRPMPFRLGGAAPDAQRLPGDPGRGSRGNGKSCSSAKKWPGTWGQACTGPRFGRIARPDRMISVCRAIATAGRYFSRACC